MTDDGACTLFPVDAHVDAARVTRINKYLPPFR